MREDLTEKNGCIKKDLSTYNGRPDAGDCHPSSLLHQSLPFQIHTQPFGQDTHADFAHGVGCFAPEEAAVNGRTHDDDPASTLACFEVRQCGLDSAVETLHVDLLHQLEALHGRVLDRGPPYGAWIVDEDI